MAAAGKVEGLEEVMGNLNRAIEDIRRGTLAGLVEAGKAIERSAKGRVPIDTGNLKGSGYSEKAGPMSVVVGFSASYAVYVHENLEARHPVGEAKFLQRAITENEADILRIVAHHARVD